MPLYEGKAKQVFATDNPAVLRVYYKDDATAFNAEKRGTIVGKGEVNNLMSAVLYEELAQHGVPNHFVELTSNREQLVKALNMFKLEVIMRNRTAGSFAKRYGVAEGEELSPNLFELSYKEDALGDPPINEDAAIALGLVTPEELATIKTLTQQVNAYLQQRFHSASMILVDFKLEFGKDAEGNVLLGDEISPDTCRLWDVETGEKLDKDRFRRDLGNVAEAYNEVLARLGIERLA